MTLSRCTIKAPAKVNLSLHIEGRRSDGYHQLNGLVAFSEIADQLCFEHLDEDADSGWSLDVTGPFAGQLSAPCAIASENIVSKAARLYCKKAGKSCSGIITLQKNLPVAAGIGGGSSDAAATLNGLQKIYGSALDDDQLGKIVLKLGADVPMCLTPTAQIVAGIGEIRQPVGPFAPLPAVLVNPGVPVATSDVFRQLNAPSLSAVEAREKQHQQDFHVRGAIISFLRQQRNDLQAPALHIAPIIADVLAILEQNNNCRLARMSGSGATCFGLYDSMQAAEQAAGEIRNDQPDWWVVATVLR